MPLSAIVPVWNGRDLLVRLLDSLAAQTLPPAEVLVVDNGENRNLSLGVRNIKGVTLISTREVNAFHLLGHQSVLLSQAAALKFSEALAK